MNIYKALYRSISSNCFILLGYTTNRIKTRKDNFYGVSNTNRFVFRLFKTS